MVITREALNLISKELAELVIMLGYSAQAAQHTSAWYKWCNYSLRGPACACSVGPDDEVAGEFNLTTLDTLFTGAMDALEGRVGAMKIDVEGYEPQASGCLSVSFAGLSGE